MFELDTLDGAKEVTIKPGTQPQETVTLSGLGVGRLSRSGRDAGRGDLQVHIDVEIPRKLDQRSREILEELAANRGEDRVEPRRADQSVFDRIREKFTNQEHP